MADAATGFAPVTTPTNIPTLDPQGGVTSIVSGVIASGKPAKLTLAQANEVEQSAPHLLAGSDMRVDQKIIDWAKAQIANGQPTTFPATIANETVDSRPTGPNSQSKGTKTYFVANFTANFGGQPFNFKALKPRGNCLVGSPVSVTVTEGAQGWNYNVSL